MDRSWMPTVAGILDILAGVLALVGVLALLFAIVVLGHVPDEEEVPMAAIQGLLGGITALILVCAGLALAGGAAALGRKRWGLMVAGAIAAAVVCPPMGVPSIILTVMSEGEVAKHAAGAA